jgi:hypothetical protein
LESFGVATVPDSPAGLYARLLGPAWHGLGEAVRRLHQGGAAVRAAGVFRVGRGASGPARLLARLAGLPAAGEAVDVRLTVVPRRGGEEWRRTFAGRPLVSRQRAAPDGLLAEGMGPLELWFRLEAAGGALHYHTQAASLLLGPLRIPLPARLAPRVSAWERPLGDPRRLAVGVEVRLPTGELLVSYEGTLTVAEDAG